MTLAQLNEEVWNEYKETRDDYYNAEIIISTISANLKNGKKAESDLEMMVDTMDTLGSLGELKEYVKTRDKIVEYIRSFYV